MLLSLQRILYRAIERIASMFSFIEGAHAMVEKSLAEQAAEQAARAHKIKDPIVVDQKVISAKADPIAVHRFTVASGRDPNGPSRVIALDASGKPVPFGDTRSRPPAVGRTGKEEPGGPPPGTAEITIAPDVNLLTLEPGETLDETLVVTVPANPKPAKADIYFLADTTGSMGSILAAVQSGATSMLSALAATGADLAFGVGNYKDFLSGDPFAFQNQLGPTATPASVVAAISAWSASGGGDLPEAAFFALHKLAEPPGGSIGWRAGSKRIIVWFGDAASHDPICAAASGLSVDITEASVTAALQAENMIILAISTTTPGLDTDPASGGGSYTGTCGPEGGTPGQATRIAGATGGQIKMGIDPTDIVSTIVDLVKSAVTSINNVKLVPSPEIAPFVTSITPAGGYGPLASDKEHRLEFKVLLTGVPCKNEPQHFSGTIDVVADGAAVARKVVRITVPACALTYSVKFICGTQPKCDCECMAVRPGSYSTAISIHNPSSRDVEVSKRFVPVIFAGAAVGREPRSSKPRAEDRIVLPPHGATMDDCCRITELLFGAPVGSATPLTVGFLEITASADVSVTAIYTAGALEDGSGGCAPSISVETIVGLRA
jgi:hypothetical protein